MPGLKQLQKFNSDIISLGNEPTLRAERGEKPVTVPIPRTVKDVDDSDDFVLGMPQPAEGVVQEVKPQNVEEDFSDITGTPSENKSETPQESSPSVNVPDFSDLLNTETVPSGEEQAAPDLSMFLDNPVEEPEPEPEPEEVPVSDLSLDDLLNSDGFDGSTAADMPVEQQEDEDEIPLFPQEEPEPEEKQEQNPQNQNQQSSNAEKPEVIEELSDADDVSDEGLEELPDAESAVSDDGGLEEIPEFDNAEEPETLEEIPEAEPVEDLESPEPLQEAENIPAADAAEELNPADILNEPSDFDISEEVPSEIPELSVGNGNDGSSASSGDLSDFDVSDFNLPDLEEFNGGENTSEVSAEKPEEPAAESPVENETVSNSDSPDLNPPDLGDLTGLADLPELNDTESDSLPDLGDLSSDDFKFPESDFSDIDSLSSDFAPDSGSQTGDSASDVIDSIDDFKLPDENDAEKSETSGDAASETSASEPESAGETDNNDSDDLNEGFTFDGVPLDMGSEEKENQPSDDSIETLDDAESLDSLDDIDFAEPSDSLDSENKDENSGDSQAFDSSDSSAVEPDSVSSSDSSAAESDFSDLDLSDMSLPDFDTGENKLQDEKNSGSDSDLPALDDFDFDDELEPSEVSGGTDFTDATDPSDFSSGDISDSDFQLDTPDFEGAAKAEESETSGETPGDSLSDFGDLPEFSDSETQPAAGEDQASEAGGSGVNLDSLDDFNLDDVSSSFGLNDFGSDGSSGDGAGEVSPDQNISDDFAEPGIPSGDNSGSDEPLETFDTSDIEGMDFSLPDTDSQISNKSNGDFDLGDSEDFGFDNGEFEIPGFSDVDTVQENKNGKMKQAAQKKGQSEKIEKNALSEEQYKKFLKNLSSYPLNVRIAVEELLVKDEFTDEAEFEIIVKVLKKVSARQLAAELEKMLDTSIPVPRDFERRTAEEYEAYKASFQYQLRNKIIPATLIGAVVCALLYLVIVFIIFCIYRPMKANGIYSDGYDLLCAKEYPQAEEMFKEARDIKKIKKWYYQYAQGFRDNHQYLRAEQWYKYTLNDFDYDKKAGIDYTEMELYDLANYEKAEDIAKRMILDNHINDEDGTLLLGDIYLEWATEKDPSKFDEANARYSDLIQRYGSNDLYLGRKMRYYVRTDKLEDVLTLKPHFMNDEDSLNAQDWTELSGYCLDKLYGNLPPKKEYLRSKIQDVKEMLVRAVKADEENPQALYNLSRYYVQVNDPDYAKYTLKKAIDAYKVADVKKRRDIYNEIDSYRLYGEQLAKEEQFLDAREAYTDGLVIYNSEHEQSSLAPAEKVGKLYADVADLDYFVSGNMNDALQNYEKSIECGNDDSHIRYKVGYIQYGDKKYSEALGSFLKASELYPDDNNLLLALGNTLSLKNEYYASQGYYEDLINSLDNEKQHKGVLFPQVKSSDSSIVNGYLKASNNYGVSLYKLAKRTGNSDLNAQALVQFQNSIRAWDALTRNQTTMVRLGGSNLAEQNVKYATHPVSDYEPAIYTEIDKTLSDEKGLIK